MERIMTISVAIDGGRNDSERELIHSHLHRLVGRVQEYVEREVKQAHKGLPKPRPEFNVITVEEPLEEGKG